MVHHKLLQAYTSLLIVEIFFYFIVVPTTGMQLKEDGRPVICI